MKARHLIQRTSPAYRNSVYKIEKFLNKTKQDNPDINVNFDLEYDESPEGKTYITLCVELSIYEDENLDFFFFSYDLKSGLIQIDTMDSQLESYISKFPEQHHEHAIENFISGLEYKLAWLRYELDN